MSFNTIADSICSVGEGINRSWTQDGLRVTRGHHYVNGGGTDFRLTPQVTLRSSAPQQNTTTGIWKRGKAEAVFVVPMITSLGAITYNTFRMEQTIHPEITPSAALLLRNEAAQFLFNSELLNLWEIGTTSF